LTNQCERAFWDETQSASAQECALQSSVLRLQPRRQPFEVAVDSYRSGFFEVCLEALETHSGSAAAALAARCLLRLGNPAAAIQAIASVNVENLDNHDRAELLMLGAGACGRLGRDVEAESRFDEALVYAEASASAALEAELVAWRMAHAFARGRFGETELLADVVRDIEPYFETVNRHFLPVGHSKARAFEYLGLVATTRENYSLQAAMLRAALSEMTHPDARDVYFESNLLANLSFFVREFDSDEEAAFVRDRNASIEWNDGLALQRFQVLQSLGWANAMRGNHVGAFRDLRSAAEMAPNVPLKIIATLDRAYLARELNQGLIAREELDYADTLAGTVDWNAISDEQIRALLALAEGLAVVSPARARRYHERYRELAANLSGKFLARFDRRARAEEMVAEGKIARAEGNPARATALLLEAFETWDSLGYRWRAATAACELSELGAGTSYREYAERETAGRPQSWLANRLRAPAV
jgi:hypothetical protein